MPPLAQPQLGLPVSKVMIMFCLQRMQNIDKELRPRGHHTYACYGNCVQRTIVGILVSAVS